MKNILLIPLSIILFLVFMFTMLSIYDYPKVLKYSLEDNILYLNDTYNTQIEDIKECELYIEECNIEVVGYNKDVYVGYYDISVDGLSYTDVYLNCSLDIKLFVKVVSDNSVYYLNYIDEHHTEDFYLYLIEMKYE